MRKEVERLRKSAVIFIINTGLLDRAVDGCDAQILEEVNEVFSHSFKFSADDFSSLLLNDTYENIQSTLVRVVDKIKCQKDIKEEAIKGKSLFPSYNNGNHVADEEVVQYGAMQIEQLEILRGNLENRKNEIEEMIKLKKQ